MAVTRHPIGCYWWATIDGLSTECGKERVRPAQWPVSGTYCMFCDRIMAYAANAAEAEKLHKEGHDVAYRHKA